MHQYDVINTTIIVIAIPTVGRGTKPMKLMIEWRTKSEKRLQDDGWFLFRHNCTSHRQFKHPTKPRKVTVNGKLSGDITGNLLKSIEKQSGLVF